MELLLGCGHDRTKRASLPGYPREWEQLVTIDINPACKPDFVVDLNAVDWLPPSFDNSFHEIHAYEVLEHLGRQGDIASFFHTFNHIYRLLVPDGHLFATCPSRHSPWLWGDPGHTRTIQSETLIFLNQNEYKRQSGITMMSDYRWMWKGDFEVVASNEDRTLHRFVLRAIKPSRI